VQLATAAHIKDLDRRAMEEYSIPGAVLMENAGGGAARLLLETISEATGGVVIVCGVGNNGGDGFVMARHLANHGVEVRVFVAGALKKVRAGESAENLATIQKMNIPLIPMTTDEDILALTDALARFPAVVDAVFGTGLDREVTGSIGRVIDCINDAGDNGKKIFSVDIPSGIHADTGRVLGRAVRADVTCTFALAKPGQLVHPGAAHVGKLYLLDISIPRPLIDATSFTHHLVGPKLFLDLFSRREQESHKGTYGHLLVVAGSEGKTGAAALAGMAAVRAGAGLVTIGVPRSLNPILEVKLTEAMTLPLPDEEGTLASGAVDAVMEFLTERRAVNSLVVGPGLSTSRGARETVRSLIREVELPMVLDADGINVIDCIPEILKEKKGDVIITPHPGELARLIDRTTGEIQQDRIGAARETAETYGVWVVLKGAGTIIADPDGDICIATGGNPGMASGGTGDVLTGLIGGFLAQGADPLTAACAGVWVHNDAGDRAAEKTGEMSLSAGDLTDAVCDATRELSGKRYDEVTPHVRRIS